MGEKKKPGRFTLQFNLEDPQQRTVSDLLEQQGRHKAQFITSAVLRYIQCPKPEYSGESNTIDEAVLEQMLLTIMKKYPQLISALPSNSSKAKGIPASSIQATQAIQAIEPWNDSMGEDTIKAISETLAAFQLK